MQDRKRERDLNHEFCEKKIKWHTSKIGAISLKLAGWSMASG